MGAKTFSITTLSIKGLSARVSIHGNRYNNTVLRVAVIVMLSIILQSVVVPHKILRLGRLQPYSQLLELPKRMDVNFFVQSVIGDEKNLTRLTNVAFVFKILVLSKQSNDPQHNDIQHNNTQYNSTLCSIEYRKMAAYAENNYGQFQLFQCRFSY
jgi:hypothetical protein